MTRHVVRRFGVEPGKTAHPSFPLPWLLRALLKLVAAVRYPPPCLGLFVLPGQVTWQIRCTFVPVSSVDPQRSALSSVLFGGCWPQHNPHSVSFTSRTRRFWLADVESTSKRYIFVLLVRRRWLLAFLRPFPSSHEQTLAPKDSHEEGRRLCPSSGGVR